MSCPVDGPGIWYGTLRVRLEKMSAFHKEVDVLRPTPLDTMLRFKQVSIAFEGAEPIISDATFHVRRGEHVAIVGPSGCGKSSLLRAVIGALQPVGGAIEVDGELLTAGSVASVRSQLAFIGQEPVLGAETVLEALLLPFSYRAHRGSRPERQMLVQALSKVGLGASILDKRAAVISGGERQRVAIARSLLLKKRVLIADEVTSALDPESKERVIGLLGRASLTVLSVSHDPQWIAQSDRTLTIEAGVVIPFKAETDAR